MTEDEQENQKLLRELVFEREHTRSWFRTPDQSKDSGSTASSLHAEYRKKLVSLADQFAGSPNDLRNEMAEEREETWPQIRNK